MKIPINPLFVRLRNGMWLSFEGNRAYIQRSANKCEFLEPTSIQWASMEEMKQMYGNYGFDESKVLKYTQKNSE